ncbi:MAG: hypothetical protein ACK562_06670 [Acidobacteriota bacterium]|jgi:hypothetical protein
MSENTETGVVEATTEQETVVAAAPAETAPAEPVVEEVSYHAVEKNGTITAIWEMRGRRHVRTIDPRSAEGRHLLGTPESSEAAAG